MNKIKQAWRDATGTFGTLAVVAWLGLWVAFVCVLVGVAITKGGEA